MLLTDEQYVIKWLSQYGPLPKAQVVRLLKDKSPATAERLLLRMKRDHRIADVGDGYYLALDPYCTPDQRIILAVWVLLQFIQRVEPWPITRPPTPASCSFSRRTLATRSWCSMKGSSVWQSSSTPRRI